MIELIMIKDIAMQHESRLKGVAMPHYMLNLSGKVLNDLGKFAKRLHILRIEAAYQVFVILAIADKEKQEAQTIINNMSF